jgi:hypothetical protein
MHTSPTKGQTVAFADNQERDCQREEGLNRDRRLRELQVAAPGAYF